MIMYSWQFYGQQSHPGPWVHNICSAQKVHEGQQCIQQVHMFHHLQTYPECWWGFQIWEWHHGWGELCSGIFSWLWEGTPFILVSKPIKQLKAWLHTLRRGWSCSRRSHSFDESWNRFKQTPRGLLCSLSITSRESALQSWVARAISSAVLFHQVATSRTIWTCFTLLIVHAASRSALSTGLLNIFFLRLCS